MNGTLGRLPWGAMATMGGIVAAAAAACYAWVDRPVAKWAHGLSDAWHKMGACGSEIGEAVYALIAIAIVAVLLWARGRKAAAWRWIEVSIAVAVSGLLIADVIKIAVSRARPSALYPNDKIPYEMWGFFYSQRWDSHFQSFPSGHATTAGVVAAAICIVKPRWWWIGVAFYVMVAASRILAEAHFVSDVLVGGYIGAVTMIMVRWAGARRAVRAEGR